MASVNKAFIQGNLGADPEVRYTQDKACIVTLKVATNRRYRNRDDQQVTETEWHRVIVFGRSAEIARDYLTKGSSVWIEGRIRTRTWTDKNGIDHYTTEIVCEQMQLGSRRDNASQGGAEKVESKPRQPETPQRKAETDEKFEDVPF